MSSKGILTYQTRTNNLADSLAIRRDTGQNGVMTTHTSPSPALDAPARPLPCRAEELAPAPATLDSFRAAWAKRLATTRTATTLTMSEHWGLRALMGDDSMPLARHAARQTMAVLTDTGV